LKKTTSEGEPKQETELKKATSEDREKVSSKGEHELKKTTSDDKEKKSLQKRKRKLEP